MGKERVEEEWHEEESGKWESEKEGRVPAKRREEKANGSGGVKLPGKEKREAERN